MRYRLAILMLFVVLPVISVLAAPAPDHSTILDIGLPKGDVLVAPAPEPSAILYIGSPPKGQKAEEYCKEEIGHMDFPEGMMTEVWCKYKNLPSLVRLKNGRPWLVQNLRIKVEDGGRRLHLTFQAGTRAEQAAILNELLRVNLHYKKERIKFLEECIGVAKTNIRDLEERIQSRRHPDWTERYRQAINKLRSTVIPASRADIVHCKQFAVIQWAE